MSKILCLISKPQAPSAKSGWLLYLAMSCIAQVRSMELPNGGGWEATLSGVDSQGERPKVNLQSRT